MCRHEGKKEIELAYPFVYSIQRTAGCSIVLDDVTEWIDKKIEIERERAKSVCVHSSRKKTGNSGSNYAQRHYRKKRERTDVT